MTRLAEPGSKAIRMMDNPHSAQIVRLYDPAKLQVRVDVPLVDAAKVGVGQQAEVIVDVLPDRVFAGRVTRVVHEADVQKNTLQVKVAIEDPTPELKPEMLARARFLATGTTGNDQDATADRLFVPANAVYSTDNQPWVWLADQASKVAHRQNVQLGGTKLDDWTEIAGGVQVGDRVIIGARDDLRDGSRILIEGEATN
jgi:multidrug efflux pump subunit AcrA (membrane-fusion protein)